MIYEYEGFHGCASKCRLDVEATDEGITYAVCAELPDNPGTSVTNRAEHIAESVLRRYPYNSLVWIEHYPAGRYRGADETWSRVTFHASNGRLQHPDWEYITRKQVEEILPATLWRQVNGR